MCCGHIQGAAEWHVAGVTVNQTCACTSVCVKQGRTLIMRSEGSPGTVANAWVRSWALILIVALMRMPFLRPCPTTSEGRCWGYRCFEPDRLELLACAAAGDRSLCACCIIVRGIDVLNCPDPLGSAESRDCCICPCCIVVARLGFGANCSGVPWGTEVPGCGELPNCFMRRARLLPD